MATIVTAASLAHSQEQIARIFWETSARQDFPTEAERTAFFDKYLGVYLRLYPQHVLVAHEAGEVLGYILGTADTLGATEVLAQTPHLEIFEDLYERYPAHLHINFTAQARGLGLGSELVQAFTEHMRQAGAKGLHLITGATARNVSFYLKNGFTHRVERLWEGRPLLLLGKTLQG